MFPVVFYDSGVFDAFITVLASVLSVAGGYWGAHTVYRRQQVDADLAALRSIQAELARVEVEAKSWLLDLEDAGENAITLDPMLPARLEDFQPELSRLYSIDHVMAYRIGALRRTHRPFFRRHDGIPSEANNAALRDLGNEAGEIVRSINELIVEVHASSRPLRTWLRKNTYRLLVKLPATAPTLKGGSNVPSGDEGRDVDQGGSV